MNFTIRGDIRYQRKADKISVPDRYRHSYHHTYLDDDTDDDTNSSMTSGTTASSRSVSSIMGISLAGLDNFMYNQPPPSVQKTSPTINFDFSEYPGIVQQIVPTTRQQDQVDDWNDDIDLSDHASFSISSVSTNLYDELIVDEEEPLLDTQPPEGLRSPIAATKLRFTYEPETDDDDMTGLHFPQDLAHLSTLIEQRKASPQISSARTLTQKTRISPLLAGIEREHDDDDFTQGLAIENQAFIAKLPQPVTSTSSSNMIKQPTKLTKLKTPTNFVSRLARPTPIHNKPSTPSPSLTQRTKPVQPRIPIPSSQIPFAGPSSREANGPLTLNHAKFRPAHSAMTERKSPAGFTLIARPKTKSPPKYCTRLDNMDNLNVLPSRPAHTRNTPSVHRTGTATRPVQSSSQNKPAGQNITSNIGRSKTITARAPISTPSVPRGPSTSSNLREPRQRVNSRPTVPSRHLEQHTRGEPNAPFEGAKDYGVNRTMLPSRPSVLSRLNAYNDSIIPDRPNKPTVLSQFNSSYYPEAQDKSGRPSVYSRFNTSATPAKTEDRLLGGRPPVLNRSRTQANNVKLIQPTRELLTNEYNNMKYDALNHIWRGNEGNVNAVLERPAARRRPMIISGGQGHAPSRYAAVVGNSMIFNPESRSWVSSHGPEHNELDAIEDLQPHMALSVAGNVPVQFRLPSTSDAIAQQEKHDAFMANWLGLLQ
ncbi:hypothetical protein INT47_000013 [Mucor saturninus]|uniref:Uncharacterized protein n=1 Tax=Mucor saturninus TaxID=64648 RepID=A0A8H7RH20_9FUNG|nr:hypothetical protein INT47_000013 [Mucor saturninus]